MSELDDVLVEVSAPYYTELRPILAGTFNISRASIPFFQASMSLDDVAKGLELVENLPSDLRQQWRLEELFQREIDWDRVDNEIVNNYLRRPEKLQFFNSLTVALLPLGANQHLAGQYGDSLISPEPRESHKKLPWQIKNIGGVHLVTADGSPHGFIRWDPKRIFPATIDGQHRLAALQKFRAEGHLTQENLKTAVPVIFLILDERAGLKLDEQHFGKDENPVLTIVREIFIDLNHTSKQVARSRRILLDDQEIESRCVRRLLAQRVGTKETGVLSLGLVHWQHAVTAKFNAGDSTGPFITTVELLYAIVKDILRVEPPKDPLDEKDVLGFIDRVEAALDVSGVIGANSARYPGQPSLRTYVERNYLKEGFEKPFSNLPSQYLRAADEGFRAKWQTPIYRVLTEFAPYKAFIAEVERRGGIEGELAFYLCLPQKQQKRQADEWGEARYEKIDKPLRELAEMKKKDWPFYSVFQKGLLRAMAAALRHFELVPGRGNATIDDFCDQWITFLNEIHARKLFQVHSQMPSEFVGKVGCAGLMWSGIALNLGARSVKWNEATIGRISSLILLWWYIHIHALKSINHFMKILVGKRSEERFPLAKQALKALTAAVGSSVVSADEEVPPSELMLRSKARLEAILQQARSAGSASDNDEEHGASTDLNLDDLIDDEEESDPTEIA